MINLVTDKLALPWL